MTLINQIPYSAERYTEQQLNSLKIILKEKILMDLFKTSDYMTSDQYNKEAINIIMTSLQDIRDNVLDVTSASTNGKMDIYNLPYSCKESNMQQFVDTFDKVPLLDCYTYMLGIFENWPYHE